MLIELTLLLTLVQQPRVQPMTTLPPDHQLALVFSDTDVRRMRLDDAEKLYAQLELDKFLTIQLDEEDERMFAALTIALGTLPDARRLSAPLLGTGERLDWEVRRGVRRAAQRPSGN